MEEARRRLPVCECLQKTSLANRKGCARLAKAAFAALLEATSEFFSDRTSIAADIARRPPAAPRELSGWLVADSQPRSRAAALARPKRKAPGIDRY